MLSPLLDEDDEALRARRVLRNHCKLVQLISKCQEMAAVRLEQALRDIDMTALEAEEYQMYRKPVSLQIHQVI